LELALNLLWLAISACALGCWLPRLRSSERDPAGILRALLVFGCAALLLFPSVSITDDLHAPSDAMEDSFSVRKAHPIAPAHDCVIVAAALTLTAPSFSSESLSADEEANPQATSIIASCSRAPPIG
jgi:hypothetical protein